MSAGRRVESDRFVTLPSGIELCYRIDGDDSAAAMVLIGGIGVDLAIWPEEMITGLTDAGYRLIRFDNRDAGLSSSVDAAPPGVLALATGRLRGQGYDLGDMAADIVGLLDHLGVDRAHVVGMSMGGMIGQTLAARAPGRVLSLTSIFSTTGHPRVGRPALSTQALLARRPAPDTAGTIEQQLTLTRHVASTGFTFDEPAARRRITEAITRLGDIDPHVRLRRQIGAIRRSGDRTAELRRVLAPTLVIHGDRDLLVHPSGGVATKHAITGARLHTVPGMGHDLPATLAPRLVELIAAHAAIVPAPTETEAAS